MFNRAVEWQLIKSSPMETIKKPKRVQKETSVYNKNEAELLLAVYKNMKKAKTLDI